MEEGAKRFEDLDHEALLAICGNLDGKSLANFQLINSEARRAALADPPWKEAFRREFPHQYAVLQKCKAPPVVSWRSAYTARQHAEHVWARGGPNQPRTLLETRGEATLGLMWLQDPLPSGLALTGARVGTGQGMLEMWDMKYATALASATAPMSAAAFEAPSLGRVVEERPNTAFTGSVPFPQPFCSFQRPGTNEILMTTMTPAVYVLRLAQQPASTKTCCSAPRNEESNKSVPPIDLEEARNNMQVDSVEGIVRGDASCGWQYELAYELGCHEAACAVVRSNDEFAVTASFDGALRLFKLPSPGSTCQEADGNMNGDPVAPLVALSPTRSYSDDPAHSGLPLQALEQNSGVCGLDISHDLRKFVSGSNDMQLKIWDVEMGRITLRLSGNQGWPWNVARLDPELNEVNNSSTDGCVRLWDLRCGQQTACWNLSQHHGGTVYPVAAALPRMDSPYIVAGSFDNAVYVLDRRMGRVLKSMVGHKSRILRMALQDDILLTTCFDGNIGVWDFT